MWVGLHEWFVKVSWLGKLALVSWWAVVSFEMSMSLVRLLATCILMLSVMFLYCWRIIMVCHALKLVDLGVELGFSVGMEAFG